MFWTLVAIARLLLGGAFVVFAVRNYLYNVPRLTGILETSKFNVPEPRNVVLAGIVLQFIGGILAAIGPFPALGGAMMIVFLVLATVLFHPVWHYKGDEQIPHLNATLINTGLVGGFLLIVATGL